MRRSHLFIILLVSLGLFSCSNEDTITDNTQKTELLSSVYKTTIDGVEKSMVTMTVDGMQRAAEVKPLYLYHHSRIDDHITSDNGNIHLTNPEYRLNGIIGYVFKTQQPNTIPLYEYYFRKAKDHVTTTDKYLQDKYPKEFEKIDSWIKGYLYDETQHRVGTTLLFEIWSESKKNHVTTTKIDDFYGYKMVNPGKHGYIILP